MLIRHGGDLTENDVTPRETYLRRRDFMAGLAGAGLASIAGAASAVPLKGVRSPFSTTETPTPKADITGYNNFYEFGVDKDDPARNAGSLKTTPWTVKIDGACNKPGTYDLADFLRGNTLQQRIYRLRCVEGWSMVIPWLGVPLADLLKKYEPSPWRKRRKESPSTRLLRCTPPTAMSWYQSEKLLALVIWTWLHAVVSAARRPFFVGL